MEAGFVHPARLLPRCTRPPRVLRSVRAPRVHPSSRTARRRSFDVTPLTARPVTLANGDCADLATGVTAYTRPSWRRIWTSPSRDASSSTSARRWRAVEYVQLHRSSSTKNKPSFFAFLRMGPFSASSGNPDDRAASRMDQRVIASSRLKCVETPTGLGHNFGTKSLSARSGTRK